MFGEMVIMIEATKCLTATGNAGSFAQSAAAISGQLFSAAIDMFNEKWYLQVIQLTTICDNYFDSSSQNKQYINAISAIIAILNENVQNEKVIETNWHIVYAALNSFQRLLYLCQNEQVGAVALNRIIQCFSQYSDWRIKNRVIQILILNSCQELQCNEVICQRCVQEIESYKKEIQDVRLLATISDSSSLLKFWKELPKAHKSQQIINDKMQQQELCAYIKTVLGETQQQQNQTQTVDNKQLKNVQNSIVQSLAMATPQLQNLSLTTKQLNGLKDSSGNVYNYDGQVLNDVPHGFGEAKYLKNSALQQYKGMFASGLKSGKGLSISKGGDKYDGDWKDDKKHGKGILIFVSGNKYDGEFKDDGMNGKGMFTWIDGSNYFGDWVDNMCHGNGEKVWSNGCKYNGEWKNDQRYGKSVEVFANGDRYEGEFKNNTKTGNGTLICAETGDTYIGNWNKDKQIGVHVCIRNDGIQYQYNYDKKKYL